MGRKSKTHEEFIEEIRKINPNIKIINKYINSSTKMTCECPYGHTWTTAAHHLKEGTGCPICAKNNRKKTNAQFLEELKSKNINIEPINEYKGANDSIYFRCKIDGHIWKNRPSNVLFGQGCPKCYAKRSSENQRKTHEDFIKEIIKINPNIEICDKYVNNHTPILCKCNIHQYEWNSTPTMLLSGEGCPLCGREKLSKIKTLSHEDFMDRFNKDNPHNIKIIGKYVNSQTKILCLCQNGHSWETLPGNILAGHDCPYCTNRIKTHEQFLLEIEEKHPNIKILGEYKNSTSPILCRCKNDGNQWYSTPNRLLSGSGCPMCNESKGEKAISSYLSKFNIKFERWKTFDELRGLKNRQLSYDFYLDEINLLIEYNGIQHYEPVEIFGGKSSFLSQQEHDKRKREYAKNNHINLLIIPYWSYRDIDNILDKELKEKRNK